MIITFKNNNIIRLNHLKSVFWNDIITYSEITTWEMCAQPNKSDVFSSFCLVISNHVKTYEKLSTCNRVFFTIIQNPQ